MTLLIWHSMLDCAAAVAAYCCGCTVCLTKRACNCCAESREQAGCLLCVLWTPSDSPDVLPVLSSLLSPSLSLGHCTNQLGAGIEGCELNLRQLSEVIVFYVLGPA